MNKTAVPWLIGFAWLAGCTSTQRHLLVHDPPREATFDSMIEQAALAPDQNIRQLLLQQSENMSVHLVRIRDREPPHFHKRYDLVVMLVEGSGTLWLQNEALKVKAGDVAVISKGIRHYFVNEGRQPATALVVFSPAYDEPDRELVEGAE